MGVVEQKKQAVDKFGQQICVARVPIRLRMAVPVAVVVALLSTVVAWLVHRILDSEPKHVGYPVACREAAWEFGSIGQEKGQSLFHTFRLENMSDQVVGIDKVQTQCGCMVVSNHPKEIGPNSAVELQLELKTHGLPPGLVEKQVQVVFATSPTSNLPLTIRGTIAPSAALYFIPRKLDFGTVYDGERPTRVIRIARFDGSPVRFLRATSTSEGLSVVNALSVNEASVYVDLNVSLGELHLTNDLFAASVDLVTDHPSNASIKIPVFATIAHQPRGFVRILQVEHLARGTFCDKLLGDGTALIPLIDNVRYEGEGPFTTQLLSSSTQVGNPVVRIVRTDGEADRRVYKGQVIIAVKGKTEPVRIPLVVFVLD